MLLNQSKKYRSALPEWLLSICNDEELKPGYSINNGILIASESGQSAAQKQTAHSFGYQWQKKSIFEMEETSQHVKSWLCERFGDPLDHFQCLKSEAILLDAGCGAAMSALAYFGFETLSKVNYLGVDISESIDVAKKRFEEAKLPRSFFIRSDLNTVFLKEKSVDIIFSEGVLHHTDDAKKAFNNLCRLLKPGGKFIFYVYKKKAPIREYTDDFIREALMNLSPDEKYKKLLSLTKLGKNLGDLNLEINIEEPIDFLGIPAGKINLQRLFFYYIFKCFYKDNWTLDQMNLTNFDWYSPQNCSRHTKEEIRSWVNHKEMSIEKEYEDDSGLSYIVSRL